MWPWLLISLCLSAGLNVGPSSPEEARILWLDAQQETRDGDFKEAVPKLRRLIDRYPSHEGYTRAHLLLGESFLGLKLAREAQSPLKYYIQAMGVTVEANHARLRLAESYLSTRQFHEAELVALELERQEKTGPLPPSLPREIQIPGKLIKARALQGLGHFEKAALVLETIRSGIRPEEIALLALASQVELELKLSECSRLPGPKATRLDEAQMKNAFERRGTCLSEAVNVFRNVLKNGSFEMAQEGGQILESAHLEFLKACTAPPSPSDRRSAKEKRQYVSELTIFLRKTCRSGLERNFSLLESMKGDIPQSSQPIRKRVLEGLEKARKEFGST